MKGRIRLLLSILLATLFFVSPISAYDGEEGYNIEDDYVVTISEEVKDPKPTTVVMAPCTAAMIYSDYVAQGYGMN